MNTPGRSVSGWWDSRNNALYLERLVHASSFGEPAEPAPEAPAAPAIGLLWRPLAFPKSAVAKVRAASAQDVARPRDAAPEPRRSLIARTIRGRHDPG